jgi:hypothetical protein
VLSDMDRFVDRLSVGDCWEWTGAMTHNGYGEFSWNESKGRAHRFAYEHFVGPIPDGLIVHHECENKACVNPSHLTLTSRSDHGQLHLKTHCPQGHEYAPGNIYLEKDGSRKCATCVKARVRRAREASVA